ncbi:MAG: 50S ribosomal protein L30 [Deltaproteobacteria bacterium]|nr:MAG: 50S ribosomal protein L30 [Deltaproteobacteria bacterium]
MAKQLQVTLKRSGIGRPERQRKTLIGLGLTKLQKTVILKDTPAIRGMIRKVDHLLEVEEIA